MAVHRYNANVLIGYWFDEIAKNENLVEYFLTKRQNSELKIQKALRIFVNLLEPVSLIENLNYGSVLQIFGELISKGLIILLSSKAVRNILKLFFSKRT